MRLHVKEMLPSSQYLFSGRDARFMKTCSRGRRRGLVRIDRPARLGCGRKTCLMMNGCPEKGYAELWLASTSFSPSAPAAMPSLQRDSAS